jgi:RNA-binding protein YlmH
MDKPSLNLSALTEEEALFLRRLRDLADICAAKYIPRFTAFLTERQQHIAAEYIRQAGVENALLYGGYAQAVRKQCGFFPHSDDPELDSFPLAALTIRYPAEKELSHRDFLGSLMAMGIKRESVGDLLPGGGRCILFLSESVLPVVSGELVKVGSTGVSITEGFIATDLPPQEFLPIRGTVGSARLDSLVKLLTGLAREKSAGLIRAGIVRRNDAPALSVSEAFAPGDTVTIRGYGKYIIDDIGSPTRKGRLPVNARQYK